MLIRRRRRSQFNGYACRVKLSFRMSSIHRSAALSRRSERTRPAPGEIPQIAQFDGRHETISEPEIYRAKNRHFDFNATGDYSADQCKEFMSSVGVNPCPSLITRLILLKLATFASGSASRITRSARLPGAIFPTSFSIPIVAAAFTV